MRTLEPFTRQLFNDLNTILEESLAPAAPTTPEAHQLFATESGWVVRVDLPGFEKEDLQLHFEDSALHLKAEQVNETAFPRPAEGHRFPLGDEVDIDAITASLTNGVLEISLPKKEEAPAVKQQIEIL